MWEFLTCEELETFVRMPSEAEVAFHHVQDVQLIVEQFP
jgi:hypothetical protein